MKIVILDGLTANPGDLSWDALKEFGEVIVYDRTNPDELIERAKDADILLTNKTVISAENLDQLPKLKYISVLATGTNIVDTAAARKRGIPVSNVPGYSTHSVAQQVFALLLAICNQAEHYSRENRAGKWAACPDFSYSDTRLIELYGKQIGIVGFGNIGQAVAKIADAFGMRVALYTSKAQKDLPEGYEKMDIDELFSTSDVVTLHCPLTPETNHLADARRLALMRPGAILINTARGPLLDELAAANALGNSQLSDEEAVAKGYLAGIGLDVMTHEPPEAGNPLLTHPRCYSTPHIAWATREARVRLLDATADNIRAFLASAPINLVN